MPSFSAEQAKAQALARFEDPGPGHINCGQAVLCYALLRMGEDPESIVYAAMSAEVSPVWVRCAGS